MYEKDETVFIVSIADRDRQCITIEKSKADELWVLDEDGAGFITKTAAEAKGGHCISEFPDEPCTYLDQSGTPNPSSPMGRYVYP